jgi:hypothetical protein
MAEEGNTYIPVLSTHTSKFVLRETGNEEKPPSVKYRSQNLKNI